ncbi:MAG: tRNA lysidine(34) synthetase TilS [Prevotella sp.]
MSRLMQSLFINKVSQFIKERHLLKADDKCLVALSGGADSVALLLSLLQLGYNVEAVHCNFHLRGEESDRDEMFCHKLCQDKGITLHKVHFDTHAYATLHKISIEMAARELRYDYFRKLAKDINASAICVAHHRDDSVETVLMNLIRGTGIHGLKGISPKNNNIIRPLLCVSRQEIEDFLSVAEQTFVTDSTNLHDDVVRNKIRLNLIPLIKEINPSAQECISRTALRVENAAMIYDEAVNRCISSVTCHDFGRDSLRIDIQELKSMTCMSDIVFNIVKDYGFTPSQSEIIHNAIDVAPGRVFYSDRYQLLIDRNYIFIEPKEHVKHKAMKFPEEGIYVYNERLKFRITSFDFSDNIPIDKRSCCMSADFDKIKFPLYLRNIEKGDRFVPFGMKGSKLISDFLTDRKTSLFDKQRQLVVTDCDNNIIWLVGLRPDNRVRITGKTQRVLMIEII